jgi:hypothetical protein
MCIKLFILHLKEIYKKIQITRCEYIIESVDYV